MQWLVVLLVAACVGSFVVLVASWLFTPPGTDLNRCRYCRETHRDNRHEEIEGWREP